jgi:NitT/TauT family transport system substrate-binding protein
MFSRTHSLPVVVRRVGCLSLAGALALTLAACGGDDSDGDGGSSSNAEAGHVKVLLPFLRSIAFWPVHVADVMGYFEDEGIDIDDEATDGSSFVVQQVSAGKAPFGIAVAEPAMLGYSQNPSFVSVYDFLTGNGFDVYVRDDSAIQTMGDLEAGDSIAIKDQAGGDIPRLSAEIQKAGLEPGADVTYTQFGENTSVAANLIEQNKVDAVETSWNSLVGIKIALEKEGINLRCITCDAESYAAESVLVTNDYLDEHKDLVEGFGRALAKATLFGQTNPDAAIAIMKTINPEEQTDPEYTKTYFSDAVDVMSPRQPQNQFGWQDEEAYKRSMELLLDPSQPQGLTDSIDLDTFVDNDLIDAFNDFDHDEVVQEAKDYKP